MDGNGGQESARALLLPLSKTGGDADLKTKIYEESKKIWKVALPSVVSRVASFGTVVVTQSFIGHVSSTDLAAYALVQTVGVRFVNGILLGMSSATETLCGQAYGAKQYHMMGIYLQRSWFIDIVTLTLLLPLFIYATPIFQLLGQQPAIAAAAGYISLWFVPFVYGIIFSLTVQMYLQAQQKNAVIGWLTAAQLPMHVALCWVFVSVLGLGVAGAMGALLVVLWFVVAGEFVYVLGGWCPATWKGFTSAAFRDLVPVVKMSISSGVMVCLELWYYSILVLLAGYLNNAETAISAFSICLNFSSWMTMIIVGLMGAACVRVANELGRGDAEAVRFSIKVLMSTSLSIGIFFWIICMAFGDKLGYLFTDDMKVVRAISDLNLLLAFTVLLASIFPVLSGVAVGAGLQTKVAVINLVCFYVVGLPVGILLGYAANLQVVGIWIGLTIGIVIQTLLLVFLIWRTDWDEEVLKTSARLKRWDLKSAEDNERTPCDHA